VMEVGEGGEELVGEGFGEDCVPLFPVRPTLRGRGI
jgi:hypothetical protein